MVFTDIRRGIWRIIPIKIEGSTLTEKQTANLFETGTFMGEDVIFRAKDVEEMTGHFTMFNYMLQTFQEP